MSIPDYQSLMRPLLAFASDGSEKNINDAINHIAGQLNLTDDERHQLLPSGKQAIFANRVHWARTYLDKAGAIKRTRRSHFQMTDRGKQLLAENPTRINVQVLKKFPEFITFQTPKVTDAAGDNVAPLLAETEIPESAVTPEEAVQQAESQIFENLRSQLLIRISESSPSFFEGLVVDLVIAMGYGGSRASVVQRLGKSGDEGIDGVVNEDPLGLDVVYIQAKRYAADNTIGRERIQQFAGALVGQGASKGVFVTTSSFSRGAIEYAIKVPQRIILIDGKELARLMVQYGVGVRVERTVEIKRIDLDYFDEGDD
ncbi:restriction endonuclease [Bradyrhizobium guangdongense]|uniref:restriction endonuclease n=1 Tax=Bradyrhizobium guangdongense TaxID=1325090 RepID=UPI00112B4EBF|nr:restriction endonuclease [Bradyrhizobium guangdongense]TPQ42367.1 restriction endonuclease [Bradyrhizobium guangdongense]